MEKKTAFQKAQVDALNIREGAKSISPESQGKIDDIYATYMASIAEIEADKSELTSDDYKRALTSATKQYTDKIRTLLGIVEWGQSKLIQDGESANKKAREDALRSRNEWIEILQALDTQIRELKEKQHQEQLKKGMQKGDEARRLWANEMGQSQKIAAWELREWLQLTA